MSELQWQDVITLKVHEGPEAPVSAGTCFSFNPVNEHLFLVGTEEGNVQLCSRAYNSKFIKSFKAHEMAVYAVQWNKFHPRVFATCGADWTVKVWDKDYPEPVFTYDLGNSVGDVCWSPYSSTVFAAVTTDGRVGFGERVQASGDLNNRPSETLINRHTCLT